MATFAFRSAVASRAGRASRSRRPAAQGNAGDRLDRQQALRHCRVYRRDAAAAGRAFDITVFDLNQYLMRNPNPRVRKLADRQIKEICRAIRQLRCGQSAARIRHLGPFRPGHLSPLLLADARGAAALGDVSQPADAAGIRRRRPSPKRSRRSNSRRRRRMQAEFRRGAPAVLWHRAAAPAGPALQAGQRDRPQPARSERCPLPLRHQRRLRSPARLSRRWTRSRRARPRLAPASFRCSTRCRPMPC